MYEADKPGTFGLYPPAFSNRLEVAWRSSTSFQERPRGRVTFEYDPLTMTQTNMETRGRRLMKRTLVAEVDQQAEAQRVAALAAHNAAHWDLTACNARRNAGKGSAGGARSRSQSQHRRVPQR